MTAEPVKRSLLHGMRWLLAGFLGGATRFHSKSKSLKVVELHSGAAFRGRGVSFLVAGSCGISRPTLIPLESTPAFHLTSVCHKNATLLFCEWRFILCVWQLCLKIRWINGKIQWLSRKIRRLFPDVHHFLVLWKLFRASF